MITSEETKKIARLARIELAAGEVEKFQHDLNSVLAYVDELQQIDTADAPVVSQVTGLENVLRSDIQQSADNHAEITQNSPAIKNGYYQVKSIM